MPAVTRYEVYGTVAGALDTIKYVGDYDNAMEYAEVCVKDYENNVRDAPWQVFVMPHYCTETDEECVCVQYLTDHSPYKQGGRCN